MSLFCLSLFYDSAVFKNIAPVAHVEGMPDILLKK